MFKSLAAMLLLGLTLFTGTSALAQTDTVTAEALMRESGLWKQLGSMEQQTRSGIQSAFTQGLPSVSQAEVDRVADIAQEAFAASRLQAAARSVIAKQTMPSHVPKLLAWYRSPTGASLAKLEEEAASREQDAAAMREDSALLASLPAKRQALLRQIAEVTRSGEALTTIMINMTVAIQIGVASAMPNGPALGPDDLRKSLEQQRPQMMAAMDKLAIASYARTYQSTPDADLEKYIAFLRSRAGKHFMEVGVRAIDSALVDAATELGRNILTAKGRART